MVDYNKNINYQTLIVDDDPVLIFLMKKLLTRNSFDSFPQVFENGQEALTFFKEDYNKENTYVILLDINMPVLNGWEFLAAIESFADPENTLVFIVTSSVNQSDLDMAYDNRFVLKLFSKPIFGDTIDFIQAVVNDRLKIK